MDDRVAVSVLIDEILLRDLAITVNDGEDDVVTASKDKHEILKNMSHTGEDMLCTPDGIFYLIYNNGSDGDPMVVITDHHANKTMHEIYKAVANKLGVE
jgi:cytochrome oxidase Cu insertion factor (SCO1/SenC/PrrC family)